MLIKTFFCEQVTNGTFNRQNLIGANFSETLTCPVFPYGLHITFLTLIDLEPGEVAKSIKLELIINDISIAKHEVSGPGHCVKSICARIEWSGLNILVGAAGTMKFRVQIDSSERFQIWNVEEGGGAHRAGIETLPVGMLIDGRSSMHNPFFTVLKQARKDILIADQYVSTSFLEELMMGLARNLTVKVITSERVGKSAFNKETALGLMDRFSGLEIRFDKVFHDRLVVRDLEEVYVFGASLKDILHNRISFFQLIFDADQSRQTLELVQGIWQDAVQLK